MKRIKNISEWIFSKNKKIFLWAMQNFEISFLIIITIIGIVFGISNALKLNNTSINEIENIFFDNLSLKTNKTLIQGFLISFVSHFIFIIASLLLAFCVWGFLFIPFLILGYGFGLGFATGFLYLKYTSIGILYNIFILAPGIFLASIAVLIIAKESIYSSLNILSKIFSIKLPARYTKKVSAKTFFFRISIVLIITFIASAIDVVLARALINF